MRISDWSSDVCSSDLLIACIISTVNAQETPDLDVPYVPTSQEVVNAMLDLAGVTARDVVYDLGCGDGRIVITAAKKYGATGTGIDIDPERITEATENAKKADRKSTSLNSSH